MTHPRSTTAGGPPGRRRSQVTLACGSSDLPLRPAVPGTSPASGRPARSTSASRRGRFTNDEQRAHLHRRRLRAAVAGDLEQLAVLHVRRAGRLAGPAAEAAIERLAGVLDGEIAGDEALHDVDPPARAVRFRREEVERRAMRQAEAARHALACELVEALAPGVGEIDRRHGRAARSDRRDELRARGRRRTQRARALRGQPA